MFTFDFKTISRFNVKLWHLVADFDFLELCLFIHSRHRQVCTYDTFGEMNGRTKNDRQTVEQSAVAPPRRRAE